MKKRFIIIGILICITPFIGYLQCGREEKVISTMTSTSGTFFRQEIVVVANKLVVIDKEKYAEKLVEKAVNNKYKNVRFSYDIIGEPDEIQISVYRNDWCYKYDLKMIQIVYSVENN